VDFLRGEVETMLVSMGIPSVMRTVFVAGCCASALGCSTDPMTGTPQGMTTAGTSSAGTLAAASGTAAKAGTGAAGTASGVAGRSAGAAASGGSVATAGTSALASGAGGGDAALGGAPAMGAAGAGMTVTEPACEITIPPSMDCGAKLAPGDERMCMLGSRMYIVHAGKTMNPCKPVGLVIDAHGASETAIEQLGTEAFCSGEICWHGIGSGWKAESDAPTGGFIVVFPQGNNNMWSASDASFMLDIVDEMKKLADIDPKKIYMTGISNGGFLTHQTGCPNADVFSGMAPMAGGSACNTVTKPIPIISFAATGDFAFDGCKSANESVAMANNCQGSPKPWKTIDKNTTETWCRDSKQNTMAKLVPCNTVTSVMIEPTECVFWDQCDGGVQVVWCEVAPNTEHGPENASLDAHIIYENNTLLNMASVAWSFFKQF
jgi:poly(3-hydroxybutyrate) depolymerase